MPSGHRYNYNGAFHYTRSVGAWWMVTSSASGGAIMIHQNSDKAEEAAGGKEYWFSVRYVGGGR